MAASLRHKACQAKQRWLRRRMQQYGVHLELLSCAFQTDVAPAILERVMA
jgi:hypothetical protein